eukprot:6192605-Prymnesium_polylepis.1
MAADPAQGGSSIDELATACNGVSVSKDSPEERTANFVDAVREQLQAGLSQSAMAETKWGEHVEWVRASTDRGKLSDPPTSDGAASGVAQSCGAAD